MITKLFTEFRNVKFYDKDHRYTLNEEPMKSVTQVVKQYGNEFDTDYWTTYKAMEYMGYKVRPVNTEGRVIGVGREVHSLGWCRMQPGVLDKALELEKQWADKAKKGRDNGSDKHKYMEEAVWGKYMKIRDSLLDSVIDRILHNYFPVRTEMIVYDKSSMIAGQVDLLAVKQSSGKLALIDYKTDEEIKMENPYQNFKKPIHYLQESTINKYSLQLNIYRYLLEKKGIEIAEMKIIHLSDPPKWYDIKRIDVKPLIDDYNKKRVIHLQGAS